MVRSIIMLCVGAALGAASLWLITVEPRPNGEGVSTPAPALLRCEAELSQRTVEVDELKRKAAAVAALPPASAVPASEQGSAGEDASDRNEGMRQATSWRISAIEKFVPLSDEQRARLEEKFKEERAAQAEGRESTAESLDEILGTENAQAYRTQVNAAFERVRNEELERDTAWMARKLGLSPENEGRMRAAFDEVEQAVAAEYPQIQLGASETPQKRVMRMIAENKRRVQLRAERLRQVLPPEQYAAYVKAESESSAADMEVFHGSGEEQEEAGKEQEQGQ